MKEKLTRCGMCGDFQQDPRLYSKEEQEKAELVYCNDCDNEEIDRQNRIITKDMAIDAGDRDLEGQRY